MPAATPRALGIKRLRVGPWSTLMLLFVSRLIRRSRCSNGGGFRFFRLLCLHFQFFLHLASVFYEFSRGAEFSQAVANHLLRHTDRNKVSAIMHPENKSYHFGSNLRAPRPSFYNIFGAMPKAA